MSTGGHHGGAVVRFEHVYDVCSVRPATLRAGHHPRERDRRRRDLASETVDSSDDATRALVRLTALRLVAGTDDDVLDEQVLGRVAQVWLYKWLVSHDDQP